MGKIRQKVRLAVLGPHAAFMVGADLVSQLLWLR